VSTNLPSSGTQVTNKTYVDGETFKIRAYDIVKYASTTGYTANYNNGVSGVGATLTNSGTLAAFVVDSVTPAVGNRVLIKN
jgi:hypothetical protein